MKWKKAGDYVPHNPEMKQWRYSDTHAPMLWPEAKKYAISENSSDSVEWLDESPTEIGQQGDWQADKKNIYISPSGEQLRIYRDGEWKQYIRADVFIPQPAPPQEGQDELLKEFITKVSNYIQFGTGLEELKSKYKLIKL